MKSNLKRIYDLREQFDILNSPRYRFYVNPIYQVNKFITDFDADLNKNFINNLEDLKIKTENMTGCISDYDYVNNAIYSGSDIGDVYGLLHVASNDRSKKYTGVILDNNLGYGLNNGFTDLFTNDINNKKFSYLLEATIAKALLMINNNIVMHSYFTNNGEELREISNRVHELMKYMDSYHDTFIKLYSLYKEKFMKDYIFIKSKDAKNELKKINDNIYTLECSNFSNVYHVFDILIDIINSSNLDSDRKEDLFIRLRNEFKHMFSCEEYFYLSELSQEFNKNICVKRRKYE